MSDEKPKYEVIQMDAHSFRIEENGVRSFLFTGPDKAVLVDSGFGTGNLREVVMGITDLPVTLVNTHADRDHIGCNSLFDAAYMHPAEYDRYFQAQGTKCDPRPLWQGDIITVGEWAFEVILIPGHTPGSIALLDHKAGVLIAGDSVQAGRIYMFGNGRNVDAYIDSMEMLWKKRALYNTVYPSHGPFPVDGGIIPELINGARRVKNGEVEGKESGLSGARLFDVKAASFLY